MKNARLISVLFALMLVVTSGSVNATEGVSPGALDRMAQVNNACPTFSWGMDSDAVAYDLVAYVLPDDASQQAELTADNEVLFTRVAGSATSWTPSAEQCFAPGGRYVWFVRAVTEFAGDEVVAASEWSAGRYFTVPAAPSAEEVARAIEVMRWLEAAGGGGSVIASSGTRTDSGAGAGGGAGASHPKAGGRLKSVPTASAAIRGEHPDISGEKYGVVGTSASVDGAGLAAANIAGGPDLVLDGSVNGEVDTQIYEWGLTRESADSETFIFRTTGGGVMMVEVEGIIAADELSCPDCVTTAEIADGGVGTADLADGAITSVKIVDGQVRAADLGADAVTSVKILDGTIAAADLADGSVTGAKIGAGAVDTGQIRAGAVENAQLADNAVNGAKILDGAVRNAELGNNAVTTDKIADGTIVAADMADGAVTGAKLAAGAVIGTKIADDTVAARHLETGAVDSAAILDGSITGADIGAAQVSTNNVVNFSITSEKLFTGAVTTSKIADGTITAEDVDPTGGVYASKSAVYETTAPGTVFPFVCLTVTAACTDSNDLPLQGVWEPDRSDEFRTIYERLEDWSSSVAPAGFSVRLCNDAGENLDFDVTIACISVPGP